MIHEFTKRRMVRLINELTGSEFEEDDWDVWTFEELLVVLSREVDLHLKKERECRRTEAGSTSAKGGSTDGNEGAAV